MAAAAVRLRRARVRRREMKKRRMGRIPKSRPLPARSSRSVLGMRCPRDREETWARS